MEELREALSVEEGDKDLPTDLIPSQDILECCQGLVICADEPKDNLIKEVKNESEDDGSESWESEYSSDESSDSESESDESDESSELTDSSDVSSKVFSELSGELSGGIVRFAHQTVNDFLGKNHKNKLLEPIEITRTCLRYLAFDEFSQPCQDKDGLHARLEKYKFSRYAAEHWGNHAREAGESTSDVQQKVWTLLSGNLRYSMFEIAWNSTKAVTRAKSKTLLHILSSRGLVTMCSLLLDGNLSSEMYIVLCNEC